jgi:hypothetical protein
MVYFMHKMKLFENEKGDTMGKTIRTFVMLLTLLLPSAPAALSAQDPDQIAQLRLHRTVVTTKSRSPQPTETPLELLEQLTGFFSSEKGLALNDTATLILLCNQMNSLEESDEQTESPVDLGVGLKIKF